MQTYTVSLFGHRRLNDPQKIDKSLSPIIEDLLCKKAYVEFLIGRNGEFDEYAASLIKSIQKKTDRQNSDLTLVLPYTVADLMYYEAYYDSIIQPESFAKVHPKKAITLRNRWMVEQSHLMIVNVEHSKGGAYDAMKYANRLNKNIVNLASVIK